MQNSKNYVKNLENPFLVMDSEAKYWLGYIFADGHIVYNSSIRQYNVSLFSVNYNILQSFKEFLGKSAKFYSRPSGVMQVSYNSKPVASWFIDIIGLSSRKAFTLNPNIEIDWDILRGYFDGDGSVRLTKQKGKYLRYEAKFTTGSIIWKDRICKYLNDNGIITKVNLKGKVFDINIRGKENLKNFYLKLYQNNTSKLEYKYNQFVALFGNKQ